MFSRPVSSGWKPVPTSSREPTRPWISAVPLVGSVMRESILSSVLLPAPLRPIMPTTSPRLTSKETSLSAHRSSGEPEACRELGEFCEFSWEACREFRELCELSFPFREIRVIRGRTPVSASRRVSGRCWRRPGE